MSEEINKILDKFDRTLEEYELDKKVGQPSIDSIYFLYPSEMITIKNYIRQNENILKEVREYIEKSKAKLPLGRNDFTCEMVYSDEVVLANELLEILDKVEE